MAIGRNFPEALQKALRSLESNHGPFGWKNPPSDAASLLRDCGTPHDGRLATIHQALRAGASVADVASVTGIDPWFIEQIQHIEEVAEAGRRGSRPRRGDAAGGQADRVLRRADRRTARHHRDRDPRDPLGTRRAPGVPRRGYLRRGVRRPHPVPVLDLRRRDRGAGGQHAQGHHPRQRAEPHRPGHRVRLRLRARVVRAGRRGLRDRDGQLQPGDGLHRLRHVGPAVLRAAHPRGRARGGARGTGERPGRRGDRPARRADAARAGPGAGGCRRPRGGHLARGHPSRRGPRRVRPGPRGGRADRAAVRDRHSHRTQRSQIAREIGYPVLVRPSYVLGGRGMEIVYDDATLRSYMYHGRPR